MVFSLIVFPSSPKKFLYAAAAATMAVVSVVICVLESFAFIFVPYNFGVVAADFSLA